MDGSRLAEGWSMQVAGLGANAARIVLATLVVQALALLAVSYLGPVHPVGDSVAVFRLQIAISIVAGAALLWLAGGRWLAVVAVILGAGAAAPIAYGFSGFAAGTPGSYVLYQKNLMREGKARRLLINEILSTEPDIVTLQEISEHDMRDLRPLFAEFEHQLLCGLNSRNGMLSRFPLIAGTEYCPEGLPMAAARAELPDGSSAWLVSVHLDWPYPANQRWQVEQIAAWLRDRDGPILIGGDFNMVPWASSIPRLAEASETRRVGPNFGTFVKSGPLLPLPIDHVFLPADMNARAEPRGPYGSDHMGVLVRFGLAGDN